MQRLLITLACFTLAVVGTLSLDRTVNDAVTARGLIGSAAAGAVVAALHAYRLRQQAAERDRQERLRRRAEAARLVDVYRRRLGQAGESCGTMIVVCLAVVVILLFLLSGLVRAANPATIDGGPAAWQMMAVGLLGLTLLKRRAGE